MAASIWFVRKLDGAFNFVRTQTSCTNIHMARGTVNNRFNTLYVGLPSSVGASMRMGDFNTKSNTLAAIITFSHWLHLLAIAKIIGNVIKTR